MFVVFLSLVIIESYVFVIWFEIEINNDLIYVELFY